MVCEELPHPAAPNFASRSQSSSPVAIRDQCGHSQVKMLQMRIRSRLSQKYDKLGVSKLSQRLFELTRRPKTRLDFRNEGRLWLAPTQNLQDMLGSIVD